MLDKSSSIKITNIFCWERKPKKTIKFYLSDKERLSLLKDTNFQCLAVFEIFLRIVNESELWQVPITNELIASKLGMSEAAANRHKNTLTRRNWIHTEKYRSVSGNRMHAWYLGPKAESICDPYTSGAPTVLSKPLQS